MPNYVTSRCRVVGPQASVEEFSTLCITVAPKGHSDEGGPLFDFESVIAMPEIVRATESGSRADEGMAMIRARGGSPAPFDNMGLYEHQIARIRQEVGAELKYHPNHRSTGIKEVAELWLAQNPEAERLGMNSLKALVETGYSDWYTWSVANWGTKWGAFRTSVLDAQPGEYEFRFETAWSFPEPVFERIAQRWPELSFECWTFDEGDNFGGHGWYNPPEGQEKFRTGRDLVTDEIYQAAHGHERPVYEDGE